MCVLSMHTYTVSKSLWLCVRASDMDSWMHARTYGYMTRKEICDGAFSALRVNCAPSAPTPSRWSRLPSTVILLPILSTANSSSLRTSRSSEPSHLTSSPAAISHRSSYACSGNGKSSVSCAVTSAVETGRRRMDSLFCKWVDSCPPRKDSCVVRCLVNCMLTTTNVPLTTLTTLTFSVHDYVSLRISMYVCSSEP